MRVSVLRKNIELLPDSGRVVARLFRLVMCKGDYAVLTWWIGSYMQF